MTRREVLTARSDAAEHLTAAADLLHRIGAPGFGENAGNLARYVRAWKVPATDDAAEPEGGTLNATDPIPDNPSGTTFYVVRVDPGGDVFSYRAGLAEPDGTVNLAAVVPMILDTRPGHVGLENQGPEPGDVWDAARDALAAVFPDDDLEDPTMAQHDDCAYCAAGVADAHHPEPDTTNLEDPTA